MFILVFCFLYEGKVKVITEKYRDIEICEKALSEMTMRKFDNKKYKSLGGFCHGGNK